MSQKAWRRPLSGEPSKKGIPGLDLGELQEREDDRSYRPNPHSQQNSAKTSTKGDQTQNTVDRQAEAIRAKFIPEIKHEPVNSDNSRWKENPYTADKELRKLDAEIQDERRHMEEVIETVMADQLSRSMISDPSQNSTSRQTTARDLYHQPGVSRGSIRPLHETKIKGDSANTAALLSKRVRFGARLLTRDGHDALRELLGFYFAIDNSITIYEFRKFGKHNSVIPIIERGIYHHLKGPRRGDIISLIDILPNRNLAFETEKQSGLPTHLKREAVIVFRITDVDECERRDILLADVKRSERDDVLRKLDQPPTDEERRQEALRCQVQSAVRDMLKKRGVRTVTGLGAYLRQCDRSGDGKLDKNELRQALHHFRIEIPSDQFESMWELCDENNDARLDYGEFMRGFIGEMSEQRKALVRKVFRKLDPNKTGSVSTKDIQLFYNAQRHPAVQRGEMRAEQVLDEFLTTFAPQPAAARTVASRQQRVDSLSFVQFVEYYEGLSIVVDSDAEFLNILRNEWSL